MPRERSHLLIAEEILVRLQNDSLRQLISRKAAWFYLGAIFPDMLISPFGRVPGQRSWSDLLHDQPETIASGMVHQMLAALREEPDNQAEKLVFTLGYLAHAATDIVFHPLVFYLSGNYYHGDKKERLKSQAAHHYLETLFDLALHQQSGKKINDHGFPVFSGLKSREINRVFEFFAGVFSKLCHSPKNQIMQHLKINSLLFMLFNRFYHNRFFYQFARLVNFFTRNKTDKYFKLLYPPYYRSGREVFSGEIRFKNLFTGEEKQATIKDLKTETIDLGVQCLEAAYMAWVSGSQEIALPALIAGKDMNTGSIHLRAIA
jgi:hypothetical protein